MTLAEAMLKAADDLEQDYSACENAHQMQAVVDNHLRLIRIVSEFTRRKELNNDPNRSCPECGKGNGRRSRKCRQGGVS